MNKIIEIAEAEVLDLCQREESDYFDRKSARLKPRDIQEPAIAFANAEGGTLVIGVEDISKVPTPLDRWVGKPSIEEYNPFIAALAALNPGIDFSHRFLYRAGQLTPSYVLELEIRRSLKVHETSTGEVLIRKGAQSLKLSASKVQDLMRAKGMVSEEDNWLANVRPEPIIEGAQLGTFLQSLSITNKDPISFSLQERLINPDSFAPTVACVLLFAENPSSVMPRQCAVKIVRYDSSHDDIERDRLTDDQHAIEGPLRDQIEEAFRILKEVISRSVCWGVDGLLAPMYPDEALYELLVNAVLHRDYGVSDNVLISVYRNRVEFRSPGRLPGYVTTKNIADARFSRNPKLVRLLSKYPDSPNKDLGEGINTVVERMRRAGFVDPIFKEDGANLYVTLRREPKVDGTGIITAFINRHGSINNRQALDLLALDSAEQITSIFSKLREQGLIAREDESQTGIRVRWQLGPAAQRK
ncbi:ATP-binding protein [Pandoraea apista]|uniref:DNA-binding protein n=1 Tax=Pandoraea apista TaxID=93218 RepID=A0ABX9ZN90_9BURK|nr:ATP-binding protein [Pandoraea apista]PTD98628.1 DNA-binding protein [Pandoraea apista]RRJ26312.1 DNA-binding protein [Pandoraea apista]RRJ79767.1 DNA-binding protein [Pandoraea apista]RSC97790.1 DNA-binding protein [Pandoraea apista]RSD17615.1 DNA-binding protein [Pandoraea apista]